MLTALVICNVILNNPIGNARYFSCLVMASLLSIFVPLHTRAAVQGLAFSAVAVLVFIFPALDAFRVTKSNATPGAPSSSVGAQLAGDQSYPVFEMHLKALEYVQAHGHTDGQQLLGAVLAFVPRSLWTGKPVATGQLINPQLLWSTSLWSEALVDAGLIGILAVFAVYGWGSGRLDRRIAVARSGVLAGVAPILAIYQIFLLRGSLQPALGYLEQFLFAFVFTMTLSRRPDRRRTSAALGSGLPAAPIPGTRIVSRLQLR